MKHEAQFKTTEAKWHFWPIIYKRFGDSRMFWWPMDVSGHQYHNYIYCDEQYIAKNKQDAKTFIMQLK